MDNKEEAYMHYTIQLNDLVRDAGFMPALAIVSGGKALIGVLGIALNLSLVFVTARNRYLHGPCNLLMALNAFCLAIFELSFLVSFYISVSGTNLVSLITCFYWLAVPSFMKYFTLCMMLVIGIDRLICISLNRWHTHQFYSAYFVIMIALCAFVGFYTMFISYKVAVFIPDTEVTCTVSDLSQQSAGDTVFMIALILNFAAVVCYIIFAAILKLVIKHNSTPDVKYTRTIFKSLMIIMIVDFIGWGSNSLYQKYFLVWFQKTGLSPIEKHCIIVVYGYLFSLATLADVPVLYCCSKEYRRAYQQEFRCLTVTKTKTKTLEIKNKTQEIPICAFSANRS
uniref:G-protein coupled receptors family 1 profile domain-containing protein n=1 Tax=Ditylenchus dipsaci TaxID=166011 RepID=A0A915D873_9BILA